MTSNPCVCFRWRCGWLLAVWLAGIGAVRAQPLTIATYNIENYASADRVVEGVYRKGYPKPEAEKAALRSVLRTLNAEVVALQEVGGQAYLDELLRDLKTEGVVYPYSVVLVADDPDRQIAVISKRALVSVKKNTDLAFKYFDGVAKVKRGLIEVRVASGGGEVTLFVVHLKSRFTERPDDPMAALQRAGEATAVRDYVLKTFPAPSEAQFVILGDFNDGRGSRSLKAMLERGKTSIAIWLPAADSRGEVWSHFYRKDDLYSRVDHVLVSPALLPRVREGRGAIFDGPETLNASDHRPVSVVIE